MARGLIVWIGAAVLACAIIAFVYLTPSGYPSSSGPPVAWFAPVTAERARARALAAEWQAVEFQLHFMESRHRLEPELARRRERDLPSVALVLDGPDSLLRIARPGLVATIDSIWQELGLGTTKIAVGVILDLWPRGSPGAPGTPQALGQVPLGDALLFPDSTDRSTCLTFVTLPFYARPNSSSAHLRTELKSSFGPCAWYARFGTPSARVRHWLGARGYDLARSSEWGVGRTDYWLLSWLRDQTGRGWEWPAVYGFAPRTVGCLGSRPAACVDAVRDGDGGSAQSRLLVPDSPWDLRSIRLIGGDHYLVDVLRAAGDDRFLEFWNTTLPIDTALSVALKMPVGDWTVQWQQGIMPTIPLTPILRLHEWLPGLFVIGLALGLVVILVRRREVR
ncbi:MAG: hypothetical protein ABI587_05750 [Gemmatimonadales bacterium]